MLWPARRVALLSMYPMLCVMHDIHMYVAGCSAETLCMAVLASLLAALDVLHVARLQQCHFFGIRQGHSPTCSPLQQLSEP